MTTLTLNTPNDVRNFAGTNGSSNSAILVSADGSMTFSSIDQAVNIATIISSGLIINGINSSITVPINDSLVISNITFNNINFSINTSTILSGNVLFNNCTFSSSISKPFSITGSNISFKGCNFNNLNNPVGDGTYVSSNLINSSNAFIYGSIGSISNINITNCIFTSNLSDRYPFISFELPQFSSILQSCYISNNKFLSTLSSDDIRAAVVFISTISTSSIPLEPARLIDCHVDNNFCNKDQMLIITCVPKIAASTYIAAPATVNCSFSNNTCGTISYMNRFNVPQNYTTATTFSKDKEGCLFVEKNVCKLIGSLNNLGVMTASSVFASNSGKSIIKENSCSWIQVDNSGDTGSDPVDRLSISIKDNILVSSDSSYLSNFSGGGAQPSNINTAIMIFGGDSTGVSEIKISDNKCVEGVRVASDGITTTTYNYYGCININDSAKILNNNFSGVISSTSNTVFINITPVVTSATYLITGNKFIRGSSSIKNYILSSTAIFTVVNNYFDSTTVDGSSTTLSNFGSSTAVVYEKNKNQTGQLAVMLSGLGAGVTSIANINMLPTGGDNSVTAVNLGTVLSVTCTDDTNTKEILWTSSLHGLPLGVQILNVKMGTFLSSGSFNGAGTGNMSVVLTSTKSSTSILDAKNGPSTNTIINQAYDAQANQAALLASSQLVTLDSSSNANFITSYGNTISLALLLSFHVLTSGTIIGWAFSPAVITYVW